MEKIIIKKTLTLFESSFSGVEKITLKDEYVCYVLDVQPQVTQAHSVSLRNSASAFRLRNGHVHGNEQSHSQP